MELEDLETDGKRRGEFVGLVYTTGKCATGNWVREGVETNERTDGNDETRADVESGGGRGILAGERRRRQRRRRRNESAIR